MKPVKENFQNKALEYFIRAFGPFQICIYTDIITTIAKTFTKEKKYVLLFTRRFRPGK